MHGSQPHRVFNFGAGPATMPLPVLQRVQAEFMDFAGLGAGLVEISHRSPQFMALLEETEALLRELMSVPEHYKVLFTHGGGQMAFSMVALNLIGLKPARKAQYIESGVFSQRAVHEASRFGFVNVLATSQSSKFDRIPAFDRADLDPDASYLHITTNNTAMGTRWQEFPDTGDVPLVGDMTSEILSRAVDVGKFGCIYAGGQKNLSPAGLAVAIVREDLLGHALARTPKLLDYQQYASTGSMPNTVNTFACYVMHHLLQWVREVGGVAVLEAQNERKAKLLYDALDKSRFYRAHAQPQHRSTMNVTFTLPTLELQERFIAEASAQELIALKGHGALGGVRASIYNAMPLEGAQALVQFMAEFERNNG